MKWTRDNFWITDDNKAPDIDYVHKTLTTTYWAEGRPKDIVEKGIRNSVMLSLFDGERQIGYTRIVSDHATFAWICDVYVDPDYRGKELGKWLMQCALEHPSTHLRIILLATRDAHSLYEQYGFKRKDCMILLDNARPSTADS